MRSRSSFFALCACLLALTNVLLYPVSFSRKNELQQDLRLDFVMPSSLLKIAAMDYKGLVADFQLLQAMFFIGEKVEQNNPISDQGWEYFKKNIQAVIDLDPTYFDPYYLAGSLLTWGAGRYDDALEILNQGLEHDKENYRIPFMMGFIHFYFLKDNKKGAEYMQIAADRVQRPKVKEFYTKLASRLAYYSGDEEFSIALLENFLKSERNETVRSLIQKRIEALKGAMALEEAVRLYHEKFNEYPTDLNKLVSEGILEKMPTEPYGGKWILFSSGRIFSTSKFAEKRAPKKQ